MLHPGADVPLALLSYATAEYCLYIFYFLGSEGGHGTVLPLPYASGPHILNIATCHDCIFCCEILYLFAIYNLGLRGLQFCLNIYGDCAAENEIAFNCKKTTGVLL